MTRPVRLQLSRRKGFDLQAHSRAVNGLPAVVVARPSKWGNPITVRGFYEAGYKGEHTAVAAHCVEGFRAWMAGTHHRSHGIPMPSPPSIERLRGSNLACWCKPGEPCHADVLLELANRPICEETTGEAESGTARTNP